MVWKCDSQAKATNPHGSWERLGYGRGFRIKCRYLSWTKDEEQVEHEFNTDVRCGCVTLTDDQGRVLVAADPKREELWDPNNEQQWNIPETPVNLVKLLVHGIDMGGSAPEPFYYHVDMMPNDPEAMKATVATLIKKSMKRHCLASVRNMCSCPGDFVLKLTNPRLPESARAFRARSSLELIKACQIMLNEEAAMSTPTDMDTDDYVPEFDATVIARKASGCSRSQTPPKPKSLGIPKKKAFASGISSVRT